MSKIKWHMFMALLIGIIVWAAVPSVAAAAAETDPVPTSTISPEPTPDVSPEPVPDETPEPSKLGKVTGLRREKATENSVTVLWNEVVEAERYEIYVSEDPEKDYELVDTTELTEYTFENMTRGTILYVKVRAVSEELTGADSEVLAVAPVPGQVTGVHSTQNVKTKITLQWNAAEGATGYAVYYRPSTGDR